MKLFNLFILLLCIQPSQADSFGSGTGRPSCTSHSVRLTCETDYKDVVLGIRHFRDKFPGESNLPNCSREKFYTFTLSLTSEQDPQLDDFISAASMLKLGTAKLKKGKTEYMFSGFKDGFLLNGFSIVSLLKKRSATGKVFYRDINGDDIEISITSCNN